MPPNVLKKVTWHTFGLGQGSPWGSITEYFCSTSGQSFGFDLALSNFPNPPGASLSTLIPLLRYP